MSHFQLCILQRRSFPSLRKPHFMNKKNKYNFNHKNVTDNCRVAFNCAHTFTFSHENSHICDVLNRDEYQTEGEEIQLYLLGRSASVIILLQ